MDYLDLTLPTLFENLALDEALLLSAEAGESGEVLRFWEWPNLAVVLGAGCRLSEDVNPAACQSDDVAIARRSSGGGTVLLGKGCLLFSLILSYDRSPLVREIGPSYCYMLHRIQKALATIQPETTCSGTSDLAVAGRKFSGNAQQRKRHFFLHHGTILHDLPLELMSRYLQLPRRQPDYREGRSHASFLMNLPVTPTELKAMLQSIWEAKHVSAAWPQATVRRLTEEKYTRHEWIHRR
jgi:lipoate-protein ligase A